MIVITGSSGYLGSRLASALSHRGHRLGFFDRALGHELTNHAAFYAGLLALKELPEVVVHAAASPGRLFCEDAPESASMNNVLGTIEVAAACAMLEIPMVFFSTSEVYGASCDEGQVDEDSPLRPRNVYATTKMTAEQVCRHYLGTLATIVRPTMPYGPGNAVGYGRAALPTFIANAIDGQPSQVHPGTSRSWCYIDDEIRALADIVELHDGGVYNVGRDDDMIETTDLAQTVYRTLRADPGLIELCEPHPTITARKDISCGRLRALGWAPAIELNEGIRRTADWLRLHEGKLAA